MYQGKGKGGELIQKEIKKAHKEKTIKKGRRGSVGRGPGGKYKLKGSPHERREKPQEARKRFEKKGELKTSRG